MAIIYSYPTVNPTVSDLVLGTDVSTTNRATKNFTVQSLIDLVTVTGNTLQIVLDNNNVASGKNIILGSTAAPTDAVYANAFITTATSSFEGTVGTGFTSITTTDGAGGVGILGGILNIASAAQINITSLGILTELKVGDAKNIITKIVGDTAALNGPMTSPGLNTNLVTEKAIAAYVDGKIENQDTLAELLAKNPSPAANPSNTTGGTDIDVSSTDDINLTWDSTGSVGAKIFGAGESVAGAAQLEQLQVYAEGANSYINHTGSPAGVGADGLYIRSSDSIILTAQTGGEKRAEFINDGAVDLYHNGSKKFETSSTGVIVTGTVSAAVGTKELPSYTFTGDVDTGMFHPAEHEIGFSTEQVLRLKVSNSGINVTGTIDATGLIEGLSFTTDTTLLKTPMTRFVKSTDSNGATPELFGVAGFPNNTMVPTNLAVKSYVDTKNAFKTLAYEGDAPVTITSVATQNNTASTNITIAVLNTGILPGMIIAGTGVTPPGARVITNAGGTTIVVSPAITIPGVGTQDITFAQPFLLNLSNDSLDVAGGTNIGTVATAVTANVGRLTINLDDNVTLPVGSGKGTYTGTKYTDGIMSIKEGIGSAFVSITTTPNAAEPDPSSDPVVTNVNGFFGPLRASAASTNIAAGVADKAVELTVAGDISPVDDVVSYPATTGTVKVQAAAGTAVAFQDDAGENPSIVYPVIGQEVSGTSIVADTKVASISGGNLVLDKATSAALVAGATLSFAASDLDVYTSGGNVRMPSFIPSTVATGKYLTNLPTPTSSQILSTDSILSGMAKLQGQITSTTGLAYEGAWRASVTAVANAAVDASVDLVIVTADPNLVKGTVVEGAGITGTIRIDAITGTAVTLDTAITIATGITLTMSPPGGAITGATAGEDASLTTTANKLNGRFYICDTVGKAEPNAAVPWAAATTPDEWAVGDWVIYVSNGAATDGWQKLDMTSDITGTGAATKIAKWTSSNTLGTGLISDDTSTVTIGASGTGDFLVEGGTTLGGGATKNTLISGDLKVNKELNIMEGLGVPLSDGADPPAFPINYGSAGQALFSGGAAATANIWKAVEWTLSDGSNTSTISNGNTVTFAATGGLATGESSKTVTYEIDYLGTNNAILTAAPAAEPILITDQIWYNDVATLDPVATINTIKKAPIGSLPFNNYSWLIDADDASSEDTVTSGQEVVFTGTNGITTDHSEAGGTHTVQIIGVADPVTGTGTALTLPVWNSGGTSIGDSMVSQDAATGTKLTISSDTPALIINDTTTDKGDLKISRALDATTYMSTGITAAASKTYGTHVFSQTDTTTPRIILTLNAAGNVVATTNVIAGGYVDAGAGIRIETDTDAVIESLVADKDILLKGTDDTTAITALKLDMSENGAATFSGNITQNAIGVNQFNGTIRLQNIPDGGNGITMSAVTDKSPQLSFTNANDGYLGSILGNTAKSLIFKTGGSGLTALILDATKDAEFKGNVEIDGNLTVDGNIIHGGGGSGTHTAKGGTFSDTIVCPLASPVVATEAFTISRAANGTMVFDVYFTNDTNGTDSSIAKKFTVVKQYGSAETTISSFKILDTGPGTFSSNTIDFTPEFKVSGTSSIKLKCMITPVAAAQTVTYTIVLGAGAKDATIVLN